MARGFLGGIVFGGVVSVVAAVAITAVIGPPVVPQPETAAVEVPPGSEFQERREDREASVPAPLPQPEPGAPPAVVAPEPDTLASMQGADTDPAAQPSTGTAEDRLASPPAQGQRGRVEVTTDAPVLPGPQAALPAAPVAEEGVDAPASPAAPDEGAAPEPAEEEVEEEIAGEAGETDPAADPAAPAPDVADTAPAMPPPSEPASEEEPAAPGIAAMDPAAPATPAPAPAPEPQAEAAPSQPPAPEPADPEAETDPEPDTATGDRPGVGTPAPSLVERADSRVSSRLPSVGADGDAAPDQAAAPPVAASDAPPIVANAAPFENPEGKPLMSVVLIDRGDFSSAVEALSAFPYPVTFAVDPAWDGAAAAAERYRAAGFEVLALVDIPEAAQAPDVEVNLAAILGALPGVVGVMEGDRTGLQSSRAISDQVAAYLRDSGHGLVMYPNGLDTARKLAEKEGVPAVTLFRDFDAAGQEAPVIRRFLDQAAFKAGQEPASVVMVGRARAETVSALILWGLADRAGRVALAPVSALLRARAGMAAEIAPGE
ncbi:Uncharacterized conserved protein YibQ, putative polysaccharide deacetylase 2 family [Lutimaribacter pacificus]|uniref:Uncharacterized conserved protein YibQ, putative polysaccharide deacetylase 2 family n=1 Tax=Lutimaribacter pacificus TaxID=391948 RepID=A0A1H0F399_9RHOB|nr:divergent polysaccharide deacetylase family protein [Lutimaribacter pacificus]SDN89102.1 Uncharacterized conserved protein YibQ, putative polysaccharide deacetylase 2 family [Lutimaribacter pacificus]SHK44207.1 Uncharacterized conserved protein YibQ, putative polysaccharide deacetylase 2 family [Lutimaribacter pacificus]